MVAYANQYTVRWSVQHHRRSAERLAGTFELRAVDQSSCSSIHTPRPTMSTITQQASQSSYP